jgi:hypothetical protein
MVEPLTGSTSRWTEHTYNANNDITQTIVSLDGSSSIRTIPASATTRAAP